jgi:hypothetical protein
MAAAAAGIGASIAVNQIVGEMKSDSEGSWYDFWNNYFRFPTEYTDLIDMMLLNNSNRVKLGPKIVTSARRIIPGIGTHKFYFTPESWWQYITFKKSSVSQGGITIYQYICYSTNRQLKTFEDAIRLIFATEADKVRTISIDASRPSGVFPLFVDKLCSGERAHQTAAIDHILENWTEENHFRCRVIVTGPRGSGKSYLGRLLKKRMEAINENVLIRLYDDFNPSIPGASCNLLINQHAKEYTPTITVIDEAEVFYKKAVEPSGESRHLCQAHTKDKQSFNMMLDSMSDTKYSMVIFTTELSPEDLYSHEEWRSFMRKGRIDFFIKLTDTTCEKVNHEEVPGAHAEAGWQHVEENVPAP